ncbi:MAG: FAD-dependent oxidoreductase, partial [Deltaproteobacteria bacterium]|nr:FAD-dependent oxidoreductase [Deltaproteobacteria bacterium]
MRNKSKYKKLFEPGYIGTLEVSNRIIKSSTTTGMANMDGTVTERLVRHYKELARGGTGLVNVGYAWVDHIASKSVQCQIGAADNEHIPGLMWLAKTIQENGAKAGLQLEHCGRQKFLGTPPMKAPSRVPWEELKMMGGTVPDELTFEEIEGIVEAFGDAARRTQMAGFDLVEVHAAHGYVITNFLSPRTNKRTDWYGGSLENRMRFLLEIAANVRKKVGRDYPFSVRLSGSEYEVDGVMIEETIETAKALEQAGVDIVHISGGNHHQMAHQVTPMYLPVAHNTWAAERVKKAVSIPVIASGSITSPDLAEEILSSGKADFVGLARPLFADPYFAKKAMAGNAEDIVPCIRCCDGCLERGIFPFGHIHCTVNVKCGKEGEFDITPAKEVKKVAVVGGGPGGMEAARVAALKGHQVTLFEKRELGGRLFEASLPSFKSDIKPLITYYANQMKKIKNIKVVKKEATPEDIKQGSFDAVVIAIGGKTIRPTIAGIDSKKVVYWEDAMNGAKMGKNILVAGGGLIGTELAMHLAEQGKNVSIVEMLDQVANGVEKAAIAVVMGMIADLKIGIHTGQRLVAVTDKGAITVDRYGKETEFEADNVVLALGLA